MKTGSTDANRRKEIRAELHDTVRHRVAVAMCGHCPTRIWTKKQQLWLRPSPSDKVDVVKGGHIHLNASSGKSSSLGLIHLRNIC